MVGVATSLENQLRVQYQHFYWEYYIVRRVEEDDQL